MATKKPQEILAGTSPQVKKLVDKILKVEGEYQHYQNLDKLKDKQKELCDRIIRLIEREVQQ